jgi:predicted RNA-binding Zn-ribbon protein involved in translation (DUF1610 family)
MQIETTYGLGDTVYTLVKRNKVTSCTACGSTGKVTLGGEQFDCPKCQGRITSEKEWRVEPGTVQLVMARKCEQQCRTRYTILRGGILVELDEPQVYATQQLATDAIPIG